MKNLKNLKPHHHAAIIVFLVLGTLCVWAWGNAVFASSNETQVQVWLGPPDTCPNVPGYQPEVPAGMLTDENGDCYTPVPDVCPNIDGVQPTIPAGDYKDDNGDCVPQPAPPTPPVDVCPNISGDQAVVPDGLINNSEGDCVKPPVDQCNNIDGSQSLVPSGMQRGDDGTCFTPSTTEPSLPSGPESTPTPAPENPWVAPEQPREPTPIATGSTTNEVKNSPSFLDPVLAAMIAIIPPEVKTALRSVPPAVARTFPYFVFVVLGGSGVIMTWQSFREIAGIRRVMSLVKRERDIAEEKDNFIALASHYLRTPITLMEGAVSSGIATKKLTPTSTGALQTAINELKNKVDSILAEIQENKALKNIELPTQDSSHISFARSAFFWVPVLAAGTVTLLANFLLGTVGEVELGSGNLATQAIVLVAVALFFYSAIRSRYLRRNEHTYRERLLEHEEVVDKARNEFIDHATFALTQGIAAIEQHVAVLHGAEAEPYFTDGLERFKHLLEKFSLLAEIEAGVVGAVESFDIKEAVDEIVTHYHEQLTARNLSVINNVKNSSVSQRRSLFSFVFTSLIDNAIKFSNEGSTITISAAPGEHALDVSVSDYGVAIPEEKQAQLFKPFSRSTSALEFNYEGLGFSLFLDKIIMDYVGGTISVAAGSGGNTTFHVSA